MKKLAVYFSLFALIACNGCKNKDKDAGNSPQPQATPPLTRSQNSEAFNTSFEKMLSDYFQLKDGLVASKDTASGLVKAAATALSVSADSLKVTELKADEAIISTAKSYAEGIASEAKALLGVKLLDEKRRSFQMISDQLYDLVRTVRYDRQVVYHTFCPMAFNDEGAYWLSNSSDIKNPYFGPKMLTCGEVKDSLDFRVK
jgi:hypothetical protein